MAHSFSEVWQFLKERLRRVKFAPSTLFILALSLLVSLIQFKLVWPWDPTLSYDTRLFYYPAQIVPAEAATDWTRFWLEPFYLTYSNKEVQAHESKPVFVLALRLWGSLVHAFNLAATVPEAWEYMVFMIATCWLVFLGIWQLGVKLGFPGLGALAAIVTLVCPWNLVLLYFPAYTQLSIALLCLSLWLLWHQSAPTAFLAGVVASLALLTNSSVIVYLGAMGLLALGMALPNRWRAFKLVLLFVTGLVAVFAAFKLLGQTGLVQHLFGGAPIDSPLEVLLRYYKRSIFYNEFYKVDTPKYPGILLLFLNYNSWVMLALLLATPFIFVWRAAKVGVAKLIFGPPTPVRSALLIWLVGFIAIAAIDLRPGVQLGRTYLVGYPFLALGVLILVWDTFREVRYGPALLLGLALAYSLETGVRLYDQFQAYHQASNEITALIQTGQRVAMLDFDGYREVMTRTVGAVCRCEAQRLISPISDMPGPAALTAWQADYILSGPEIPTVLPVNGGPSFSRLNKMSELFTSPRPKELPSLVVKREIPFWPTYPLLIFEDEFDTWGLITTQITASDYRVGPGTLKVWQFTYLMERADIDGDGWPDILYLTPINQEEKQVVVRLADGSGLSEEKVAFQASLDPQLIWLADINADGREDLMCANVTGNTLTYQAALSNGSGFETPFRLGEMDSRYTLVDFQDVNGDHQADAIYFEAETHSVWVATLNGQHLNPPSVWVQADRLQLAEIHFADVDGDGLADLLNFDTAADDQGILRVGLSTGTAFSALTDWATYGKSTPQQLQLGDVNDDGKADVLYFETAPRRNSTIWVSLSSDNGLTDAEPWLTYGGSDPKEVWYLDVNGDKRLDAVYFDRFRSQGLLVSFSTGHSFTASVPYRGDILRLLSSYTQ